MMNTVVLETNIPSAVSDLSSLEIIPHTVRDFGVEARKPGRAWEAAFNGPIQSWQEEVSGETTYGVTVRLSRMKDPVTRELYSVNLLFYMNDDEMRGMHNVYDIARRLPFTRIRGPRTPVPACPARVGRLWYDANPEGVIMEDLRLTPTTLPQGGPGFFVTGQGYRGKVVFPDGRFIHDVGVYGGYLDPAARPGQLELSHLFGGIEFKEGAEEGLTELGDDVWVKGIAESASGSPHVESYKNSVRLPSPEGCPSGRKALIGARSMSETKQIAFFESASEDGLSGFHLGGIIDGLGRALGMAVWDRVHRVGLGSNFVECPELGGYIGLIHVVLEKNNPNHPETLDAAHPGIDEQYEGWVVWLTFDAEGRPQIKSCVRAITPDDVPSGYEGLGELFDTKRVAFPVSLYRRGECLSVGYGWGDRALFQAEFDYGTVTAQLAAHGQH